MSSPTRTQVHSINPTGADGIVRCYCNEPAPLRTSRTATNPNRDFYCCSKDRDDKARCKFYKWKDDLDRLSQPPPSQGQMSSEPTPSQRHRAEMARGPVTPSPKKRSRSPTSSQATPSRRLADIEAALAEDAGRQRRLADIEASIGSTSQVHRAPQTVYESDDDDVFHSTISSPPRSTHYHIHLPSDGPSSPKRAKFDGNGNRSGSMLMTPPRSDGRELRGGFIGGPPESPSNGKRKEREDEGGDTSLWQRIMDDQEHPFHERAALLRGASQSVSHQAIPSSPQSTVIASNGTPESIKTLISDLSSALPSYIAKLERKQMASEKSSEAKARKIEELDRENSMLRNKVRVLEETVSALKARRPLS